MVLEAMNKRVDQTKLMSKIAMEQTLKSYGSPFDSQSVQGISTNKRPINSLEGVYPTSEELRATNLIIEAMNKRKKELR